MYVEGNNPDEAQKGVMELLSGAFKMLWRDRMAVFLIALAYTMFFLLISFMPQGMSQPMLGSPPDMAISATLAIWILTFFLIYFVGATCMLMLIARMVGLGGGQLFDGGVKALANRTLRVLWRMICAMGWMILVMFAAMLVISIISFVVGLATGGLGGSSTLIGGLIPMLIGIAIGIAMMALIFPLYVIINFAVISESQDMRMPIRTSFKMLRGSLARPAIATAILYFGLVLVFAGGFGGWLLMGGSLMPQAYDIAQNGSLNFFSAISMLMGALTVVMFYCFVAITAIATEKQVGIALRDAHD